MSPEKFIEIWTKNDLTERGGAQPYIEDLCSLIGIDPPRSSKDFCYEKDLEKALGGKGWADVWKRGHFGLEHNHTGCNTLDSAAIHPGHLVCARNSGAIQINDAIMCHSGVQQLCDRGGYVPTDT